MRVTKDEHAQWWSAEPAKMFRRYLSDYRLKLIEQIAQAPILPDPSVVLKMQGFAEALRGVDGVDFETIKQFYQPARQDETGEDHAA